MDGLEPALGIRPRLLARICANLAAASDAPVEVPMEAQPVEPGEGQPQESEEFLAEPAAEVAVALDRFWSKPAF